MTTSSSTIASTLKSQTFGIEIETVGCPRRKVAEAIGKALEAAGVAPELGAQVAQVRGAFGSDAYEVRMADGRAWTVMRDGSLQAVGAGEYGGAEIVSPVLTYTDLELLQAIVREVRKAGAVSASAHNCGIHVHVGMVNAEPGAVGRLALLTAKVDGLLREAVAVDPSRAGYCKPLPAEFLGKVGGKMEKGTLARAWGGDVYAATVNAGGRPDRYSATRYHGLNLNSWFFRGTVEFRYFNGTLHAGEVKAYVQFCLGMVAKAVTSKSITSERRGAEMQESPFAAMDTFLRRRRGLCLTGPEFATMRLHMTKRLQGAPAASTTDEAAA